MYWTFRPWSLDAVNKVLDALRQADLAAQLEVVHEDAVS